jgi:hypothetical protein
MFCKGFVRGGDLWSGESYSGMAAISLMEQNPPAPIDVKRFSPEKNQFPIERLCWFKILRSLRAISTLNFLYFLGTAAS